MLEMRKWLILVAVLAVAASACGGEDSPARATSTQPAQTSETAPAAETTAPRDTAAPEPTSSETVVSDPTGGETDAPDTTVTAIEPPPEVEGPPAPDFALALADGSEFMLSVEQKPVYLVFWAEW